MDPASITSLATVLLKTAYRIYTFYESARTVDRDVQALQGQIEGLTNVLRSLTNLFARQVVEDGNSQNRQLWASVAQALEACRPTLLELERKLGGIAGSASPHNIVRKATHSAAQTARLTFHKDDVQRLFAAMQTHSINLQLAVGIVQVMVSAAAPGAVAHELAARFERLEKMITAVDIRLASQAGSSSHVDTEHIILHEVELDDTTRELRRSAETVISSASTVSSAAWSKSTQPASLGSDAPIFEYVGLSSQSNLDENSKPVESTTGSEFGAPIRPNRQVEIHDWIRESSNTVAEEEEETDQNASTASRSAPLTSIFSGMGSRRNTAELTEELFDESSDEDELQVQVVQALLIKADAKADEGDYATAEQIIALALKDAKMLTARSQSTLDLNNVQLKYAHYCLNSGKDKTAEEIFLELTQEPITDPRSVERVLHAYHGLARLHLGRRNLDAARTHCMQALKGRRRSKSIGKFHPDYLASLRLFAVVSWAKGDHLQAEIYSDMLPDDQKIPISGFDEVLEKEYVIRPQQGKVDSVASPSSHEKTEEPSTTSVHDEVATPPIPTAEKSAFISPVSSISLPASPRNRASAAPEPTLKNSLPADSADVAPKDPVAEETHPDSPKEVNRVDPNAALMEAVRNRDLPLARVICSGSGSNTKPDINTVGLAGDTPLLMAVKHRDMDMSYFLLIQNASVDFQDDKGRTAIMIAASNGEHDICTMLLSYKPQLDLVDWQGATALLHAARFGRTAICHMLLDAGANVEIPDKRGKCAYEYATSNDLKKILKFSPGKSEDTQTSSSLRSRTTEIDQTRSTNYTGIEDSTTLPEATRIASTDANDEATNIPKERRKSDSSIAHARLMNAIEYSRADEVESLLILLENTPLVNQLCTIRNDVVIKETALHFAVRKRSQLICKLLLDHGAMVNKSNSQLLRPLDLAIELGFADITMILVESGAFINSKDRDWSSPLIRATRKNDQAICEILLNNGADPNFRDHHQFSALQHAASKGFIELYYLLIGRGANEDAMTSAGLNTLMLATSNGHTELCRLLVKRHSVSHHNYRKVTALHLAVQGSHPETASILLENGADAGVLDALNMSPLMLAVRRTYSHPGDRTNLTLSVLLRYGADPHSEMPGGLSPFLFACRQGSAEAVKILSGHAKVSKRYASGHTLLMEAARSGQLEVCVLLVRAGADREAKDDFGHTAAFYAKDKKVKRVVTKKWYQSLPHLG